MLLIERGRHWTGDALGPVTRGPVMWADGGMVVSVVRQGFLTSREKPCEPLGHISVVWEMSLVVPNERWDSCPCWHCLILFGSVYLACLEMEKSHGNQCVELFGCEFRQSAGLG